MTVAPAGGLAPLVATVLVARYGPRGVAGYVVACCAITVVATWFAPETHRARLDADMRGPARAGESATPGGLPRPPFPSI